MKDNISVLLTNDSVFQEARGNLAFLLSVIRCGEQLSDQEEQNVRRVIQRLYDEEKKNIPMTGDEAEAAGRRDYKEASRG